MTDEHSPQTPAEPKTPCPRCGFSAPGIRCPRCNALKAPQCIGSCSMCGLRKCVGDEKDVGED